MSTRFMDWAKRDVRYAIRQLRRHRGFSLTAVATLAAGIAASAVMFGVVDRLMFRAPEYVDAADRLKRVLVSQRRHGIEQLVAPVSYRRFIDLRESLAGVGELAVFSPQPAVLGRGADLERVTSAFASSNFFSLIGVRPALGRWFLDDEDHPPNGARVAVIGYGLWQRRFGSDSSVVGRRLRIEGEEYSIIGVAPPRFTGVELQTVDIWLPVTTARFKWKWLSTTWADEHSLEWLNLVVRLYPRVTSAQVEAILSTAYARSKSTETQVLRNASGPAAAPAPRAVVVPLLAARGPLASEDARVSVWLTGVAGIVLVIACLNVAHLLLVRGLERRREIAVRLALGATRSSLVRQLLVESLMLAVFGGIVGLILAHWAGSALGGLLLPTAEWTGAFHDLRVLGFGLVITFVAAVVAGVAPAIRATGRELAPELKTGAGDGRGHESWLHSGLLISQTALTAALLIGAGLFVKSLDNVRSTDFGIDADRLVIVEVDYHGASPPGRGGRQARNETVLHALRTIPGVESASTSLSTPFTSSMSTWLETGRSDSAHKLRRFLLSAVGPEYFATTGMRLLRGRPLNDQDRAVSPNVVVVSDAMARVLWPGDDALNQCLKIGGIPGGCSRVVGIARNVVHNDVTAVDQTFQYWVPESQWENGGREVGDKAFIVRVRSNPDAMAAVIRARLQPQLSADVSIRVRSFDEIVDPELHSWRLGAAMFSGFGLLSLLIAAVGLYGLVAYQVSQRQREIGIRMSLGARFGDLMRMILGSGLRLTTIGIVVGAAVAAVSGRWLGPLLFGVSPFDPIVYGAVITTLFAVALLASLRPAWRAAHVDPVISMRAD